MKRISLMGLGLVLAAAGCSGGNVTYIKMATGALSAFSGTDCPGVPSDTLTFTGIDGAGTLAIYSEPNNKVFLDVGNGVGVEGTQSGSNYTFNSTWADDDKQTNFEIQTQQKVTLTLTSTSNGYTGTITVEDICQATDNEECGGGNPLNSGGGFGSMASADGHDFDCTETGSVSAIQVSGVQQFASPGSASFPTSPNPL